MLHMRHHAALELEDEGVPLFMTRKNLTLDQAFLLYVEMLARCIAVPSFREGIRRNPMASAYGRFTSAKRVRTHTRLAGSQPHMSRRLNLNTRASFVGRWSRGSCAQGGSWLSTVWPCVLRTLRGM
jgi:hypothetical protein